MMTRIETALRRWRRKFSRSEWMAKLLKLPASDSHPNDYGLIIIQVDGLAYPQLEKALTKRRMPFLRRLIRKEHYSLHHLFPGVPSTTPAVQAELFYGVRAVVPAFGFMMRDTNELVRMYEPSAASKVEQKLEASGERPLLQDGSCYLSLFRAGTSDGEAHFCPASRGWGPALREASPWTVLLLLLSNLWGLVRTGALLVVETILALIDSIRGVIGGQDLWRELMFVPTRVAVTILMRELCTFGVKIDIARGLPIIYVNLLGYDEQSHRRGPSSAFAHWTLKGIDDAIARIWRAAHRSERRQYDVWIMSDHGQEHAEPYESRHGRGIGEALTDALASLDTDPAPDGCRSTGQHGHQLQRARLFGSEWIEKLIPDDDSDEAEGKSPLALAALGPVAMLYNLPVDPARRAEVAQLIVEKASVPLVLYQDGVGDDAPVRGWHRSGPVELPKDGHWLMGDAHPFPDETAADLEQLCRHPDAGDFLMVGWCAGEEPMTFAVENGSHGGPGPNETHGFCLLPADIRAPRKGYWRAEDLRQTAQAFLERAQPPSPIPRPVADRTIRVMTYNVHSCRGVDGRYAPERIARVIARYQPDVVALQELDVSRPRSGSVDQAQQIAHFLEMEFHFHPAIHLEEERYGDAILSRLPMRLVKRDILPGPPEGTGNRFLPTVDEPRGALWVEIDLNGEKIQLLNTHLGLQKAERLAQVEALLGPEWLGHADCRGAKILVGDFNALPNSAEHRLLCTQLRDAQLHSPRYKPQGTYFSRMPKARIDYVFVDRHLRVKKVQVPSTELTRLASDHLPLITDIELPTRQKPQENQGIRTEKPAI